MKVIVSCANGAGTSMMMMNKIKQAFKDLGYSKQLDISHCSLSEGKSTARTADAVFCAQNFVSTFDDAAKKGVKIVGMKNILSVDEAKQKIEENGLLDL